MRVSLTYRRQSVSLSDNKKKENKNGGREYKERKKGKRKKHPATLKSRFEKNGRRRGLLPGAIVGTDEHPVARTSRG